MGAIFVSYRRSDSQGEAGRLFDDLVHHFGEQTVFMDVAGIEAGRDFRKAIEESVAKCGVLLVVMGPEWLTARNESGARRLDDPADFVRIETASALRRDIPVVPVLVHGAKMPGPDQLPDDLKDLAYRNCIELTHARWRSDIQLLIDALRRLVGDPGQMGTRTQSNEATPSAHPGPRQQAVPGPSKLEKGSAAQIDPAAMQRVSRELALHIGPIADIVVRRAASHCASVDDLYLKVAEEIDSRDEREKFLLHQARSPATALPAASDTTTLAHSVSGKFGEPAPSEASNVGLKAPRSAPWIQRSSRRKYLLPVVGGSVFLVLLLALAIRFARPRGAGSSQIVQTTPQKTQVAESVPINSSTLSSPAEPRSKTTEPVKSPAKGALGKSGPSTPQRVRVSQGVSTGLLIKKVTPNYPPLARQARVQGLIVLQAEISKEGTIQNLQLISGHPMLAPAAIEAVKQWRYKPYVINGKPVAVETQVTVDFALKNQ